MGGEYRRDTYASMVSLTRPLSVFRRDSPPFPNAPVTEARFGSVIGRLEYASDGRTREDPGLALPEPGAVAALHGRRLAGAPLCGASLTLEVARPSFGRG